MHYLKKWMAFVLMTAMLSVVFAGCASQPDPTSADATPAPTQQPDPTQVPVEEDPVEILDDVMLKFACWDYEVSGYDKEMIQAYMDANSHVTIDVIDITAAEYPDKMTVMLAGGEDLDVFYAKDPTMYGGLVAKNQIMAIDALVAKDNVDLEPYGSLLQYAYIDDSLYGLPYRSDFWLLYYNKSLFEQKGVDYPTNNWEWDDFVDTAAQLTSGSGADRTYGAYIHTWASVYFMMGLQKGEGNLIEGDYEMLRDGLNLLYDMQMVDKTATDYATNVSQSAHYRGSFELGNIGMQYMGSWFIQMLVKDKEEGLYDFDWGLAQMPNWQGMEKSTIGGITPVVLNVKTDKLDAAWDLVKYTGGEEGAKILSANLIMPGYRSEEVLRTIANVPGLPDGTPDALKTNKVYVEWPPSPLSGMLGSMVNEEIQLVMTGNKSIDEAIASMEERRIEIIAQNQ